MRRIQGMIDGEIKTVASTKVPFDMYLHLNTATPNITATGIIDATSLTVDSIVGISAGDAITILEENRWFQSIVKGTATNTINLSSPLDYKFTSEASVYVGVWNLKVDGSSTSKIAKIFSPPNSELHIYSIKHTILDGVAMDDAKFGGITALTNGIFHRIKDGNHQNLDLIVNNSGFNEFGYKVTYSDKAPAGLYGMVANKDLQLSNGCALRVCGAQNDELQLVIRDNLTALTQFACIASGHIYTK